MSEPGRETTAPFLTALAQRVLRDSVVHCELVPARGDEPRWNGGCPRKVAAVKWEDGFLDIVCDVHAIDAQQRGVEVVWAVSPPARKTT